MFRLILGHEDLSATGIAPQEGGPRSTAWGAQRWSATSAYRTSRSGAPATEPWQVSCRSRLVGSLDFQGGARDWTALRTVGSGAGSLRETAPGRGESAGAEREAAYHRHGLQRSARGPFSLDGAAGGRRGGEATPGSEGGQGNHPAAVAPRRSQAVAGKKCGTCRS